MVWRRSRWRRPSRRAYTQTGVGSVEPAKATFGSEVGGDTYSLLLYALCESAQAKRVLEIGTGWGYSTATFCRSLAQRGGSIVSIDPHDRMRSENATAIRNSKVECHLIKERSADASVKGEFDLLYIDGDPTQAQADFERFAGKIRPGGLIIMDGYGGQPGPTDAVDALSARRSFVTLPYHSAYSFSVHRKPPPVPQSGGGYWSRCEDCQNSAVLPTWGEIDAWADRHISDTRHTLTIVAGPRQLKYRKGLR